MVNQTQPTAAFISTKQLAEILQTTRQTIYLYVRYGNMPKHKIGKKYLYSLEEVNNWISSK